MALDFGFGFGYPSLGFQKPKRLAVVEKAATLLYESTASSSTRQPRSGNIERNQVTANEQLLRDYFDFCGRNPVYIADMFRRGFGMRRELFERIVEDLVASYDFFVQRNESIVKQGFSSLQKCTSAIRQLTST